MKKVLVSVAINGLFLGAAFGQVNPAKSGKTINFGQKDGPRSLLSLYLTENEVKTGKPDTVHFRLMSLGTEPLLVQAIELSPGLELINRPEGPINPGNYVELALAVTPAQQKGMNERRAIIKSNSGRNEELVLRVNTK